MNIVPLSEVDLFLRDSLFEIRQGIATARNNNQSNPLLGIMVDLPEKIDFEMMVISGHQLLSRSSVATETKDGGAGLGLWRLSAVGH
ncbi:MAG: hypothetical protein EBU96_07490, partial [Actinobacteria bacterium]|nr:hypothetical protein [Actinomycetota bacterium]